MLNNLISIEFYPYISLLVIFIMFVGFIKETYSTEVISLSGAAFFIFTGILPYNDALTVFSNPAPWTIAAMFIISGALVRTGTLSNLTIYVTSKGGDNPKLVLGVLGVFVILASAFMNNTPVVVIMIPVALKMAKILGVSGSKLLIPLSYIAILGGLLTLIGTSTSLLIDGIARAEGLEPFTMFEVTPLAIILVVFGVIYLRLFANELLPSRKSMADLLGGLATKRFITELSIPNDSDLVGMIPSEVSIFKHEGSRVIDIVRKNKSLRHIISSVTLEVDDRVVLKTYVGELLGLNEGSGVQVGDRIISKESSTVEALITPGCKMIGRKIGKMHLRRNFGVYVLAVHRKNQNIGVQLDDITIKIGDTILCEGAAEDIERLAQEMKLVDLAIPSERPYRRSKAPIVIFSLAAVVILAALGVAPIFSIAVVGVAAILLSRCIDGDEAFEAVDGRLLILIFSMLAIGAALQKSGSILMIVNAISPQLIGLHPFFIIWFIYILTSILTELVSNNAVAVVVTPIGIALANSLGIDPRPLVVAIMIAASASFATPIGYQTNTLVYGPGGYSFQDFLKIGVPLNIFIGIISSALIPFFWPL